LTIPRTNQEEAAALVARVRSGDEAAFVALTEPYRRQLHLHCYRMLGSFDEAEDLVQETLLRAWRGRAGFEGRSMVRTWLYRIATNACLDALESRSRRLLSLESPQAAESNAVDWLQPYPDRLLDQIASSDSEPDELVIARKTIELAYLAAIQYLPPKQRAILILRDALGWSAKETAHLLDESVPSVNSALHRARTSMRMRLPQPRLELSTPATPTTAEQELLERYMEATDRADVAALTALLREEVRLTTGEFDLLTAFVNNANQVLSRDRLLDLARSREAGPFDRTIDVQVGRLRRKLEDDPQNPSLIKTVRGSGYIFTPAVDVS